MSGVLVRALLEVVERLGHRSDGLLHGTLLSRERLAAPNVRVPLTQFAEIGLRAVELTKRPDLGLLLPQRSNPTSFDVFAPLLGQSSTIRELVRTCARFQHLLIDHMHLDLTERAGVAWVRFDLPRVGTAFDAVFSEFAVAGHFIAIRGFAGTPVLTDAWFEHPAPTHRDQHDRLFEGEVRFDQAMTALSFPAELLDRPLLPPDPELHAVLHAHAERRLDRLAKEGTYTERLTHALVARPTMRGATVQVAAGALGVSGRSLQRALAAEGTSYRAVVDSVLEEMAKRMLRSGDRSLQEIARELGFSDATAFHRAFKRWTAMTVQEYRDSV